jgi:hypothetical protein
MTFINLIRLYDFKQVLLSERKHPKKEYYFYTHIQFTINYLL